MKEEATALGGVLLCSAGSVGDTTATQFLFLEVRALLSLFFSSRFEGSEILAPQEPFLSSKYVRAAPPKRSQESLLHGWGSAWLVS